MIKKEQLQNPAIQYRPDVRWWLAEGFHTDETLKKEIKDLYETGFGAVEFLAMEELGIDHKKYGWGSEEWIHDSGTIVRETADHDMGVSMTCGTNWSNANLINITPDDPAASKELDYECVTVRAGESYTGPLLMPSLTMPGVTKQDLIAVTAVTKAGSRDGKDYLDQDHTFVLTDQIKDHQISWKAPEDGDYLLFFFWIHGTGQTAKPSAAVSYTINYIDKYGIEAFQKYWDQKVITENLQKNMDRTGRAMMYMDSLELSTFAKGGQLWGYHFLEEFQKRRGYDLTPYLPFIVREAGRMQAVFVYHYYSADQKWSEKLYNDLYQTMTDCYCDNMMKPMQAWLHTHGMELRSEISYGLPFEISQPGKYVDGIETESLEFASQIDSYRGLAGAAHIYNKLFSSETGATLLNYMEGLNFYTQIIYTQFAAGVTRTVLHGYSSEAGSKNSTYWPGHEGMWPIFSERFGRRQPAYIHYQDWTKMLSRYQMLLRQGKPRMDLGIVRLDYNFNNAIMMDALMSGSEEEYYAHSGMRANKASYWKDMHLQNAGYTYDYFAPQLLKEEFVQTDGKTLLPDGPGYQALILYQDCLPIGSAEKILELAKKGLPVLFVNGCTETTRPGTDVTYEKAADHTPFLDGKDQQLKDLITKIKALPNVKEVNHQEDTIKALKELGVTPRVSYAESNQNILTCMRQDDDTLYLFVYNMQYTDTKDFAVTLNVSCEGHVNEIDCWNGRIKTAESWKSENGITSIDSVLAPGQARMFAIDLSAGAGENHMKRVITGTYDLPVWNLTVEDWNEGECKEIVEDRGLGLVTHEYSYETKKTLLPAVQTELKPWKDIEGIGPDVSGTGSYETDVTLPSDWNSDGSEKAELIIDSINNGTLAVYINGQKTGAADFSSLHIDAGSLLHAGTNHLKVEVTTTLNNRLKQRGYYDRFLQMSMAMAANANNANSGMEDSDHHKDETPANGTDAMLSHIVRVRNYGMCGHVKLVTYKEA
jgi:hypothetical protein